MTEIGDGVEATGVRCSNCGAERSARWRTAGPPTPCLRCGDTHLTFSIAMRATMRLAGRAAPTLGTKPSEGWEARWRGIERELATVQERRTGTLSGEAIGDAERQLRAFYVLAFHLRDALIEEASTTGIPEGVVKAAVRNDPALALLADLANLDKHGKLNDPPKSGHAPRLGEARGASSLEAPGWRLALVIEHAGRQIDGLQVAADAVEAWRRMLAGWRLIPRRDERIATPCSHLRSHPARFRPLAGHAGRSNVCICRLFFSAPGRTRTCDIRIRSPMLYPAELRGLGRVREAGYRGGLEPAVRNPVTYLGNVDPKPVKVAR
jgi:hypothetical protein